ncbi:helicase-related protein [Aliivibrio finisterrensis]|uniref:Helicase n=1 Tax=Aliivibrio finisterrensis TaxID=511998 RepID=A0ABY0I8R3_9GAMM|nr:helicase-related protein [Aliivibrio finisterrensis]RYU64322.1 helicase [Aliivibrio finisterrensis]RYU83934.1 helicase [Aliivibrio finisterrensis]
MLIDNVTTKVSETLSASIQANDKLSVMTGLFSIYAFDHLKDSLSQLDSARLLFSQAKGFDSFDSLGSESPFGALNGTALENKFRNQLNQKAIAQEFAHWLEEKASVRLVQQAGAVHQHITHVNSHSESIAINGAQFNGQGIGLTESNGFDMISLANADQAKELLGFFNRVWGSKAQVKDAKALLQAELAKFTTDQTPQFIYFITLYNIFKDFVGDLQEDKILKTKTGFKDTIVWNKLYKFQKDGVLGAIDKLEHFNGCIIADSVGLGKTFEALAVIKYYELRNDKVLVLCPKKLRDNWLIYTQNDKRNLLSSDRFNYDVLNHTDMSRNSGFSGDINLETINWGNYDLVVIDESHNFRNNNPKKDGRNRYQRLLEDIIQAGVKTKVLMLSATPVNNRLNDMKNQVAFITEANDQALHDHGINSIEGTLRQAQTRFSKWAEQDPDIRTSKDLLDSMNFDYFKLLDIYTIARSRKHIEKYYGTADIGKFPTRVLPVNIKAPIDLKDQFPPLEEVNKTIRRLSLAFYSPMKYVRMDKKAEYARRYDQEVKGGKSVFKQVDREESLIHLIRINLLKRMESSIHSFTLTSEKVLTQVDTLLNKIHNFNANIKPHINKQIASDELTEEFVAPPIEEIDDLEFNSPELAPYLIGNKTKVRIQDMDLVRFAQDLEADRVFLQEIVRVSKSIHSERDAKLSLLKEAYLEKCKNPINGNNKKVIIFTAFADTAEYLYKNLSSWASQELGLHSAIITGQKTETTLRSIDGKKFKTDLNSLLTHFSPRSKEREKVFPEFKEEVDILIATDCISEGQNLQDCDYLINYDIHWNPVRIIQRFGRIDRLGSVNDVIQLVNFWPNMELDEYINLEARVSGRMVLLDISATGEENVIEQDPKINKGMNDLEYRRKQLEQLQNAVVDLEEISGGVSITDLTLNDFRMDLSGFLSNKENDNTRVLEQSPIGLFAPVVIDKEAFESESSQFSGLGDEIESGLIFCLKDIKGKVQVEESYSLAPYYLVYVSDEEEILLSFTQSKQILDLCKKLGSELTNIDQSTDAYNQFARHSQNGKQMKHYQNLLAKAVENIAGKSEEIGATSLFNRGGTVLSASSTQNVNDFEVVSYMVIL